MYQGIYGKKYQYDKGSDSMVKREIIEIIKSYIFNLKKNGINPEKVILFGSYINSIPDEWSDIDIAVISSEFGKDTYAERVTLSKLAYPVDPRLEVHPIGTFEFENESWKTIIHEIRTTGFEIAA
jgi:predicted nucleotidyltransferase